VRPDLRVGVPLVVDHLVFVTDGARLVLHHEVLEAAVAPFGDLPLPFDVELIVGGVGDDVLGAAGVPGLAGGERDDPVLDFPEGPGRVGLLVATPAVQGLAVEQGLEAVALRAQGHEGQGHEERSAHESEWCRHMIGLYR
jgi:hypothetical protein